VLVTFFGFGLLLAFTPCVLPMIPILSGIIVGQAANMNSRRGLALSAVYVLAMALTYALAGIVAGLFGRNLQAAFQAPAVLIGFAALFVVLALSMFGVYELQLPASLRERLARWSGRHRGGAHGGVAIMGALSAVIVGPCVAPPLAGALLYIAQSGDASLGGAALFVLALGMGTPLLAIGASAGHWLPRAGAWMEAVKHAFGFLLLGVALWLLERILPPSVVLAGWGILLICAAVALGALEALPATSTGLQRFWKGLGLVLFTWGAAALIGAAAGGERLTQPLGLFAARAQIREEPLPFRPVKGLAGLEQALAQTPEAGQPVMLDFYADWCIECKQMERSTFADRGVRQALGAMTLLQSDVTANDAQDRALLRRFELFGPPAILFFDAQGREIRTARVVGYVDASRFRAHVADLGATAFAAQ
jgi:thiol:disulfide interchange protein DsbD